MAKLIDVYGERKAKEAIQDTWGHLVPKTANKYFGWIIIAVGAYGDTIIVNDCFQGLENSPWQFNDFHDFVNRKACDLEIGIYKLDGWYKKYKNGNYRISGKFKKIDI